MSQNFRNEDFRVAVVGAGVIGLSTATQLQKRLPHLQVDLIAEKFTVDTCSDGAAGIFLPGPRFKAGSVEETLDILRSSYKFYNSMLINDPAGAHKAGIIRRAGYLLSAISPDVVKNSYCEKLVSDYRPATDEELNSFATHPKYGTYMSTIVTECRKYLPYLTNKFETNGGNIIIKKLKSFRPLADEYDLVFNCTGLGSSFLCNDNTVTPIRGQVFKVRAPWLKVFVYDENVMYMIPGTEFVTLGGIRQFDYHSTEVDKNDSANIWEKCTACLPSLKNAQIDREWVGLRPYRPVVRIEKELMTFEDGKQLQVVHDYGHGGYGVMSSHGCAEVAINLGMEFLNSKLQSKL